MQTQTLANGPSVPDVEGTRIERDQTLCLLFLKKKDKGIRNPVPEIVLETGVSRRTLYRAFDRQMAWAEKEFARCKAVVL